MMVIIFCNDDYDQQSEKKVTTAVWRIRSAFKNHSMPDTINIFDYIYKLALLASQPTHLYQKLIIIAPLTLQWGTIRARWHDWHG